MMRLWTVPVLLFLAVPACSGEVVLSNETTASVTSTGVGGSDGSGGEGSGGVGGTGGIGGAPVCTETHDELNVELSTWDGKNYGCNLGQSDFELSAAVVDSPGAGLLVLDSCSPAADCTPFLSKLSISAPGVHLDVPKGTFVKVHIAIIPFMGGCGQRIQITNLPSWDGEVNPVMGGDVLWFLGVDGSVDAFADTPVSATTDALGCFPGEPPGCGLHEDYVWHFRSASDPKDPGVVVPMGATASMTLVYPPQGYQTVNIRNLRSYSTGICDGSTEVGYWMVHDYGLD